MAPRDPNNLTQGVGYVYWAPIGTAEPADNTMVSAPPSPWVDLGFTDGGISMNLEREFSDMTVDQILDVIAQRQTSRALVFQTGFAEPTLDTWHKLANQHGTTSAVTAGTAGSGTASGSKWQPGAMSVAAPTYCMLIFDGFAPGGFTRRILVRRALFNDNIETEQQKEDKTVLGVSIRAMYVSTSVAPFAIIDQTAAAV